MLGVVVVMGAGRELGGDGREEVWGGGLHEEQPAPEAKQEHAWLGLAGSRIPGT